MKFKKKIQNTRSLSCLQSNCSEDNLKYWDIDSLSIVGLLICGQAKSPIIDDLLAVAVSLIFSNTVHSISCSHEAAGTAALSRLSQYCDLHFLSMESPPLKTLCFTGFRGIFQSPTIYAKPEVTLGLRNYYTSTSKLLLAAFCAASGSEVLSLLTKIIDSYTLEMEKPC